MQIQEKGWLKKHFKILDYSTNKESYLKKEDLKENNIIQIDGGGILGILPSYSLLNTEQKENLKIHDIFDTYYGTSTGSIIASLLAINVPLKEILRLYVEEGPSMFVEKFLWIFRRSKYSSKFIDKKLYNYFGDITFKEVKDKFGKELNVSIFNVIENCTEFCNAINTPDMKLKDAVLLSISAPGFFGYKEYNGKLYTDGGTGIQNCSANKAFNQAYFVKKIPIEKLFIYSLGCGIDFIDRSLKNFKRVKNSGILSQAINYMFTAQKDAIDFQIKQLNYRKQDLGLNFKRCNVQRTKELTVFDTSKIKKIVELVDK